MCLLYLTEVLLDIYQEYIFLKFSVIDGEYIVKIRTNGIKVQITFKSIIQIQVYIETSSNEYGLKNETPHEVIYSSEKGRDLTQSYDKVPIPLEIKKSKDKTKSLFG